MFLVQVDSSFEDGFDQEVVWAPTNKRQGSILNPGTSKKPRVGDPLKTASSVAPVPLTSPTPSTSQAAAAPASPLPVTSVGTASDVEKCMFHVIFV